MAKCRALTGSAVKGLTSHSTHIYLFYFIIKIVPEVQDRQRQKHITSCYKFVAIMLKTGNSKNPDRSVTRFQNFVD